MNNGNEDINQLMGPNEATPGTKRSHNKSSSLEPPSHNQPVKLSRMALKLHDGAGVNSSVDRVKDYSQGPPKVFISTGPGGTRRILADSHEIVAPTEMKGRVSESPHTGTEGRGSAMSNAINGYAAVSSMKT